MSNYNNFVSDFPGRCADLLSFENAARFSNREVTLMLCIAMPSIVFPHERLKGPRPEGERPTHGHPLRDWERFDQAKKSLEVLNGQNFIGSPLWPDVSSNPWSSGKLADVSSDPDAWAECAPKVLGLEKKTKTVLDHIRNALAHGNIFTRGRREIEQIIMLSEVQHSSNKFKFLAVAPADFRTFLLNWLKFLRNLNLPVDVVSVCEEVAA